MKMTVKQLRRMLAEAAESVVSVDAAVKELKNTRLWLGRMSSMTPFSMWYKGDHKRAVTDVKKAARELSKSAAAEGDKALQKAARDYALEVSTDSRGEASYALDDAIAARGARRLKGQTAADAAQKGRGTP